MRTKVFVLTMIWLIFSLSSSRSQNEAKKWYFGNHAGLDFSTSPPTVLNNSSINTFEGCASISDPVSGQLLFYTDGITVWNSGHVPMANGTGLFGNSSTTQSAIIIKQPGNANLWYIFTLDLQGSAQGLCYSVVDMNLAAGSGSVITKNVFLYGASTEKVAAVRHCNNTDAWIVSHKMGNSEFRCYQLTSAGVSTNPVISTIGPVHFSNGQGYLRISSNGRKLACAQSNGNPSTLELYDFDPATGVVSNYNLVSNTIGNAWGVEFSPDCSKLYCGTIGASPAIYQWDLCAGSIQAIQASSVIVGTGAPFPCLQNGPDGKIYCAKWSSTTMAVINNPNATGVACNFALNAISLTTGTCNTGLPNFVSNYFRTLPSINYTVDPQVSCNTATFAVPGGSLAGCIANNFSLTSYQWIFDDASTGALNTSTLTNTTHVFSHSGTFNVKLAVIYNCGVDTIRQNVTIALPQATVQSSGVSCSAAGSSSIVMLSPGAYNYTWMPVNTTGPVASTGPGIYTVLVNQSNSVCVFSSTFQINPPVPMTATVSTSSACGSPGSATVQVTPGSGSSAQYSYQWNGSPGNSNVTGLQPGVYTVVVTDGLCSVIKNFAILSGTAIALAVQPPSSVCCLSTVTVTALGSGGSGPLSYNWSNGTTTQNFTNTSSAAGTVVYTVTVTDPLGCKTSGTTQVTYIAPPSLTVTSFTVCPKTTVTLTASGALSYSWSPGGQTSNTISAVYSQATTYTVLGFGNGGCKSSTVTMVKIANCTGLEENSQGRFSVYPNPCTGVLHVTAPVKTLISIQSPDGRTILVKEVSGDEYLDLSNEAAGVFIISSFTGDDNRQVRLIKSD